MSGYDIEPLPPKLHDFRAFLWLVWSFLGLPPPTRVQLDIAHWLQHGPRRKITQAFRGVGKSWITSAYVVWRLRMDPQLKFLVVSASKTRADDFTTFTLRLIKDMPLLQCLAPRSDQRESKIAFDVGPAQADHSPSVKSVGIYGQLTGTRADEIIPDDIEVANNSATQLMRDKLSEAVKEFDAIIKPGGRISFLGTPQTEMSVYNVLAGRGYMTRIWPARYPSHAQLELYADKLAPLIITDLERNPSLEGRSTDPKRFSEMDLMERECSYGRSGFALQFMLDTRMSDADRYPLKLSDLVVMDLDVEIAPEKVVWAADPRLAWDDLPCVGLQGDRYYRPMWVADQLVPYTGCVMAIDPSGRGKDETAYAIVAMLNGYLFTLAAGGIEGGYSEPALKALANLAKTYKVKKIIIESNFGDGMFTALLKPVLGKVYPCSTEEVRHSIQKEKRIIDVIEPVMNQHRLIINRAIIKRDYESTKDLPPEQALKYQLFYQMSRITRDKGALSQDDRLDALAIAVAYWVNAMAQDADKQVQARQSKLLDEELAQFTGRARKSADALLLEAELQRPMKGRGRSAAWSRRR